MALDDEPTFEMLRRGDSIGVFQLEGAAMRSTLRSLAPTSFDDVAALVALYRPGPMAANMHRDYPDLKNGRKPVTYLHPDVEAILGDTYGLMLYQESVMRVAQRFSGYSLEEADNLRKACGKKNRELIAAERKKFIAGCVTQGYGEVLGKQLFDIIEPFADYAFNKSHSYGYGLVAYQTAWLKANYPVEYLAALLVIGEGRQGQDRRLPRRVPHARDRGARAGRERVVLELHHDPGDSRGTRLAGRDVIVFGLSAVRNVGEAIVEHIVAARERGGPFVDFYDFCRRVDSSALNKRAVESLAKAGAFDSLGHPRKGLCLAFEGIVERALVRRREEEQGIATLFSLFDEQAGNAESEGASPASFDGTWVAIPDLEFDKAERLAFEKEMLGLYVSDHPLMGLEKALRNVTDVTIRDLLDSAGPGGRRRWEQSRPAPVRAVGPRTSRSRPEASSPPSCGATPGAASSWRRSCSRTSRRRSR